MSSVFKIKNKKLDFITGNSSRFLVSRQVIKSVDSNNIERIFGISLNKLRNQYADVYYPINGKTQISFGGWFRFIEPSSEGLYLVCGWGQSSGWGSTHIRAAISDNYITELSYQFGTGSSTSNVFVSNLNLTFNTWYHLGVTYNGQQMCLYLNGELLDSSNFVSTAANNDSYFRIASYNEGSLKYSSVDAKMVFLYDKAIPLSTIKMLYNTKIFTQNIDNAEGLWNFNSNNSTTEQNIVNSTMSMNIHNGCEWIK